MALEFTKKPNIAFFYGEEKEKQEAERYAKHLNNVNSDIIINNVYDLEDYDIAIFLFTIEYEKIIEIKESTKYCKKVLFDKSTTHDLDYYSKFDFIISIEEKHNKFLTDNGIKSILFLGDVDLDLFGPDIPIEKREFFVLIEENQEQIKKELSFIGIECITRNENEEQEEKNQKYNMCVAYLDTKKNKLNLILESMACGLIPIVETEFDVKNLIKIKNKNYVEEILRLKNNRNDTNNLSKEINKDIIEWSSRIKLEYLYTIISNIMCSKKGISLL
jgi:vacuolar-type H+-ATPase subunit I/STV1